MHDDLKWDARCGIDRVGKEMRLAREEVNVAQKRTFRQSARLEPTRPEVSASTIAIEDFVESNLAKMVQRDAFT